MDYTPEQEGDIGTQSRILIVDDSRSIVGFLKQSLESDYIVKTAFSGEEALEIIKGFEPDLILLDVIMPGADGYAVCRKIRSDSASGFLKVIMISSGTQLKERLKGYEAGVDDYIGKPIEKEELLAKVRVFLRLKSVEDQLHGMNTRLNDQVRIRTKQLIHAEKMAALGKHAAGIVHNLRTPLQAIFWTSQFIEKDYPEDRHIKELRDAAVLMKNMIATILVTGSKEDRQEAGDVSLNEVLYNHVELLKANPFFKHSVQTEMNIRPLPGYSGVYAHFSQCLGNLINNAVDAMYESEQKNLTVRTSSDDEAIEIIISDTGCGIPEEQIERIFDPFFTTKPLSTTDNRPTGTGLGLASSKEMIESYGGKITVDSLVGKGSTFTVRFPLNGKKDP